MAMRYNHYINMLLLCETESGFAVVLEHPMPYDYEEMAGIALFDDINNDGILEVNSLWSPENNLSNRAYQDFIHVWLQWDGESGLKAMSAILENQADGYRFMIPVAWMDALYYDFYTDGEIEWTEFYYENDGKICNIVGDINLTGITDYSEMFKNCTNLNYLNICVGEKTPTNVSHMFEGCSNLELFDIYRMEFDGITSYEGMFAGCNKLCKIRVKDIQNEMLMNILNDENNNFAEVKEIVSSHVHDLTEEERGVIEGLGWGLKGMVAHYAYDSKIASNYLPLFNVKFSAQVEDSKLFEFAKNEITIKRNC